MAESLLTLLVAVAGCAVSAALLACRSPALIALTALSATSLGLWVADRFGIPTNLIKIYISVLCGAGFVLLGRVPRFRTEFWEYLLPLFFFGRLLVDFARPGFELRYPFGGVGDGLFLGTTYFYFKKAFAARAETVEPVLWTALGCSAIIALGGLYEAATGHDLFPYADPRFIIEGRIRINSVIYAPEYFGAVTSLAFCVALLLYQMGRLRRFAMGGISAILILATALSLYRGIWLALVVGMVFLVVLRSGRARIHRVAARLLTVAALLTIVTLSAKALLERSALYEQRIADPENVNDRLTVYDAIARAVIDRPWLGYGTGTVEEYLQRTPLNTTDLNTPHNGYLAILYENGLVFLLIYLGWFAAQFWRIWRSVSPSVLISGAMLTIVLVIDMTMYFPLSFDYPSLLVLMIAALAAGGDVESLGVSRHFDHHGLSSALASP